MVKITHPSMRRVKSVDNKQNAPETYFVDDATVTNEEHIDQTTFVSPVQQEVLSTNESQTTQFDKQQKPPVQNRTKSVLESLLFLGRSIKNVTIDGVTFELSTLTQKENAELMKELYNSENSANLLKIRALTLAYAIRSVNGSPLEDIPLDDPSDEEEFKTSYEKKLAIIENMQKNVTEKLHDAYIALVDESDNVLNKNGAEELKN